MSNIRKCRICGCTDNDCSQCIEKTGKPCHWVEEDLCSACEEESDNLFNDNSDDDDSECWLCNCGHFVEDGFHCPYCGAEPPWGCPCSECQSPENDSDIYEAEIDL